GPAHRCAVAPVGVGDRRYPDRPPSRRRQPRPRDHEGPPPSSFASSWPTGPGAGPGGLRSSV
ncbi:MAG: hypothetical protein AVDCRST_MAG35-2291, partial [uncultured Quadrisphaera sp.]